MTRLITRLVVNSAAFIPMPVSGRNSKYCDRPLCRVIQTGNDDTTTLAIGISLRFDSEVQRGYAIPHALLCERGEPKLFECIIGV